MIHILIVEDEKPISNLIRMSLTKAGYNCTCAFDGEEAWNLISANPYDLILLDVMIPKIDGFTLMQYIRPMKVPVIFRIRDYGIYQTSRYTGNLPYCQEYGSG